MKAMKKIMSLLLVLTMAMGLSITAFAATPLKNGTLAVTGAQLKDKEVTAVRMFTANVDDKNNSGMIDDGDIVSYEMETAWQGFFDKQLNKGIDEHATSEEAYNHVKGQQSEEELITFAKAAKDYYNGNTGSFSSVETKQTADSQNTATFTNLLTGYYLVLPANGSTGTNRATDAMIVNVPGQKAAKLEIKTEYPSVDKVIVGGEHNHGSSAQIGDTVQFQLTAKVPNMAEFTTYYLAFKDTLSAGLTLSKESIKVTVVKVDTSTVELTTPADYTLNVPGAMNESFTVVFEDLKTFAAGDTIKVEYSAVVNKDAQIGLTPNTNKAELDYSNTPDGTGHGTSNPSETKTYTFDVEIHKYANNDKTTLLPGAEFQLHTNPKNEVIKLYKDDNKTYHVANTDEIAATTNVVDSFVTVDAGNIVIKGLKAGKYQLEEINPPAGYNKLTKPVEFEIQAQYEEDGTLRVDYPKYIVDNGAASAEHVINVQNKNGAFLPETGSIGTIGLTIAGVALVIVGLGFTSRKKKEQE